MFQTFKEFELYYEHIAFHASTPEKDVNHTIQVALDTGTLLQQSVIKNRLRTIRLVTDRLERTRDKLLAGVHGYNLARCLREAWGAQCMCVATDRLDMNTSVRVSNRKNNTEKCVFVSKDEEKIITSVSFIYDKAIKNLLHAIMLVSTCADYMKTLRVDDLDSKIRMFINMNDAYTFIKLSTTYSTLVW